jgi:hypothetical protein
VPVKIGALGKNWCGIGAETIPYVKNNLENKGDFENMKLGIGGPLPDFISQ